MPCVNKKCLLKIISSCYTFSEVWPQMEYKHYYPKKKAQKKCALLKNVRIFWKFWTGNCFKIRIVHYTHSQFLFWDITFWKRDEHQYMFYNTKILAYFESMLWNFISFLYLEKNDSKFLLYNFVKFITRL